MAGLKRERAFAYVPAIHVFLAEVLQDVDVRTRLGMTNLHAVQV
jgi:hypothetical protein